jgi:hypothetical protein
MATEIVCEKQTMAMEATASEILSEMAGRKACHDADWGRARKLLILLTNYLCYKQNKTREEINLRGFCLKFKVMITEFLKSQIQYLKSDISNLTSQI